MKRLLSPRFFAVRIIHLNANAVLAIIPQTRTFRFSLVLKIHRDTDRRLHDKVGIGIVDFWAVILELMYCEAASIFHHRALSLREYIVFIASSYVPRLNGKNLRNCLSILTPGSCTWNWSEMKGVEREACLRHFQFNNNSRRIMIKLHLRYVNFLRVVRRKFPCGRKLWRYGDDVSLKKNESNSRKSSKSLDNAEFSRWIVTRLKW